MVSRARGGGLLSGVQSGGLGLGLRGHLLGWTVVAWAVGAMATAVAVAQLR